MSQPCKGETCLCHAGTLQAVLELPGVLEVWGWRRIRRRDMEMGGHGVQGRGDGGRWEAGMEGHGV